MRGAYRSVAAAMEQSVRFMKKSFKVIIDIKSYGDIMTKGSLTKNKNDNRYQ